jgi:hypothetical protein
MAKSAIPNPLDRRHLIERELAPAAALKVAEAYLAEERVWEAIAFLLKAGARDRLLELAEQASRAGDAFLVRELCRAAGQEPTPEGWAETAAAARAAGKERFAAQAQRQAGRPARSEP